MSDVLHTGSVKREAPGGARSTENFRRQHKELFEIAMQVGAKLGAADLVSNAADVRRLLAQLAGKLKVHARMEDEALYPRLLTNSDPAVRQRASALFDEVDGLYDAFEQYLRAWPSAAEIAASPTEFARQTMKVFRTLGSRMRREEEELYPLADELG